MSRSRKAPRPVMEAKRIDAVTTEYTDGIDAVRRSSFPMQPTDAEREAIRAIIASWPREWTSTLDGAMKEIEDRWQAEPQTHNPAPMSKAAYRSDILGRIKFLRRFVQKNAADNLESIIVLAIELGRLIEDARWRFSRGDDVRKGQRARTAQRLATQVAAQEKRHDLSVFDAEVALQRKNHPTESAGQIAEALWRADKARRRKDSANHGDGGLLEQPLPSREAYRHRVIRSLARIAQK